MAKRSQKFHEEQKKHIKHIFEKQVGTIDPFYIITDEVVFVRPQDILTEIQKYYTKMYKEPATSYNIPPLQILNDINSEIYSDISAPFSFNEVSELLKELSLLNHLLTIDTFSDDLNAASIILIPKKEDWNGDLGNLRPITLINTIKKIFSALLTKRLTNILEDHNILKGNNYGFRNNCSTKDPLFIFRSIIDDALIEKKKFYSATMDVQKAYDTVPFASIINSLRRLKIPEDFIKQVQKIIQRNIFIDTPVGHTDPIIAHRGLPQGDPMSPILWNIFYDPLLIKIQERTGYKLTRNVSISVVAYADDIHPISETKEELQNMIDDIETFLNTNNMNLNPNKSKIITNDALSNFPFKIHNQTIKTVPPTELVRILGVYWSMNGYHQKTIEKIMKDLQRQINTIQFKYIPGKIMSHLINTVILPQLVYKLQFIPIKNTILTKINTKLRKLMKVKFNLPINTNNSILYDKRFGIGMNNIDKVLHNQLFSDLLTFLRTSNLTSRVMLASLDKLQMKSKYPLSLLYKPVMFKSKITFGKYIINRMFSSNMSFQTGNENDIHKLLKNIPSELYLRDHHILYKLDLTLATIVRPSNSSQILSFSEFYLQNKILHEKTFDEVPHWWQIILRKFGLIGAHTDLSMAFNLSPKLAPILRFNLPAHIPPEIEELEIWTDGSLTLDKTGNENHKMGAAAIFWSRGHKIDQISTRIEVVNPSSTKAELIAILTAFQKCLPSQKLKIMTDSQAAIDAITNIMNEKSERKILKYKNHDLLEDIKVLFKYFVQSPIFIKVKSHSNIEKNEEVEVLAKAAADLQSEPFKPHNSLNKLNLYLNSVIINQYPNFYLKHIDQDQYKQEISLYLQKKRLIDFSHNNTLTITHQGMNKKHVLDADRTKEQAFRIQLITNQLPVLKKVNKWNSDKRRYTHDEYCPKCLTNIEDMNHIFTCKYNNNYKKELYNTTIHFMRERLKEDKTYSLLKNHPILPTLKHLMYIMGIKGDIMSFLHSTEAQGIITHHLLHKFQNTYKTRLNSALWTHFTMDCWLSAFYKVIWKSRNKRVLEKNKDITRQKRPSETDMTNAHPTKHIRYFISPTISVPLSSATVFKFRITIPLPAKLKRGSTSSRNVQPRRDRSSQIPRTTEEIPPISSTVLTPHITPQIKRITLQLNPKQKNKITRISLLILNLMIIWGILNFNLIFLM